MPPTPTKKPGIKTTEFWLLATSIVIGALYSTGTIAEDGNHPIAKGIAVVAAILGSIGYAVVRTKAKNGGQ